MGVLDAENANKSSSSSNKSSSSKSSSGSTKSSGSTSNHASEREIDRSTANRSSSSSSRSSSSSPSSERSERPSSSSVGSDRREIDRSLSERSTGSDRSTGLNTSGNRASGAGPMSSSNRNTTPAGLSPTLGGHATERGIDRSLGSRTTPATPTGGLYTSARATEIKSMNDYDQYQRTDLASKARAAENKSMVDLARERVLGTIKKAEAGTVDPYNRLVGGGPKSYDDLTSMTVRDAITYASTLKSKGHLSNVLGAFQFKDTTLANIANKLGVMDEKFTPEMQDKLAQGLLQDRANRATVNGQIDVDTFAEELAKEWASLATKDGKSYYNKNGIDKASVDYATVRDMAKNLVDYGVVSPRSGAGGGSTNLPSQVATLPTSRPSFEEKYLGGSSPNTGGLSPKQVADYKDYGLNRSYGPVNPVSRPSATQVATASPAASAPPQARPAATSSALPGTAPAPSSAPRAPKELTTGQQIAAGGIDVLGGMVPGLGTGLTIVNAGLKLTGNRTVGEMIVGDFANGGGQNGSVLMASNGSDRPERAGTPKSKAADPVVRFEETYLAPSKPFDDGVKRPTPAEKWGTGFNVATSA